MCIPVIHVHTRKKSPPWLWCLCQVINEHFKNLNNLIKLKIMVRANKACRVRSANMSAIERNHLRGYGAYARLEMNILKT